MAINNIDNYLKEQKCFVNLPNSFFSTTETCSVCLNKTLVSSSLSFFYLFEKCAYSSDDLVQVNLLLYQLDH